MPVELTEESTHDDIQVAVAEAIQNVEVDRAGETDAAKISAETDEPVTERSDDAETDSDIEDTAPEGEDSPQGTTGDKDDSEWLDDDLKAEVAAYGISEEELADFTSREEVERALRFFDRSALEAGRKATADKKESEPKEPAPKEIPEGQYQISLDKDVYDEDLVDELTRMRDHYDSRVAAMEERFSELDARADEQKFDGLVDSLGHADLFGKSGKETKKELERRQDLFVQAKAHQLGLQQLGRDVDLNESLVSRVARMVFADELGKKELKARTRKVSKQSNGRQGGGTTRPSDPAESLKEEARRLYKELENA